MSASSRKRLLFGAPPGRFSHARLRSFRRPSRAAAVAPSATGTLVETATVTAANGVTDPAGGNDSATDTDALTPQADLQVTVDDGQASAVPGTPITYTIVVTNVGPSDAPLPRSPTPSPPR